MNSKKVGRIIACLLMYIGIPAVVCFELAGDTVTVVLVIIYLLVVIPIGILQLKDYYRSNHGNTLFNRVFNLLFRVPLALFGVVSLLTGMAIVGWVLYNVFIERQKEYTGPSAIWRLSSFGVALPLMLFGWSTLRSVVRRKELGPLTSEEQEEFDREEEDEENKAMVK